MEHVAMCGICCDTRELRKKLSRICSSGVEEVARDKVATSWEGKGTLCKALD